MSPQLLRINTLKNLQILSNLKQARLIRAPRELDIAAADKSDYVPDTNSVSNSDQASSNGASSDIEYQTPAEESEINEDLSQEGVAVPVTENTSVNQQTDDQGEQSLIDFHSSSSQQELLVLPRTLARTQNQETLLKFVDSPHIVTALQFAPPS